MDGAEFVEVDPPGLLPAFAEVARKLAQVEPDPPGFLIDQAAYPRPPW
jgi:hypothetical protein